MYQKQLINQHQILLSFAIINWKRAIINIDRYNQFLEYLEWKISDTLDELPSENISAAEADRIAS